jgi:hypothetical protein
VTQPGGSLTAREQGGSGRSGLSQDPLGERDNAQASVPPKHWPLWVWPPLAVALIAVAGYSFGVAGALITAASTIAALIFVAGDLLYAGQRRRAWVVVALSLGAILLTALMWQVKIPWVRMRTGAQALTSGPVDLRGMSISQAQATRLDLRGAQLSGAVLNGLILRGKQMEGVAASGASFRYADLSFASLRGADLNGADFSYACLIGTDFSGATLNGADVNHATLDIQALPPAVAKTLIGIPVSPRAHQTKCP